MEELHNARSWVELQVVLEIVRCLEPDADFLQLRGGKLFLDDRTGFAESWGIVNWKFCFYEVVVCIVVRPEYRSEA